MNEHNNHKHIYTYHQLFSDVTFNGTSSAGKWLMGNKN
jgi:hypothetical protein